MARPAQSRLKTGKPRSAPYSDSDMRAVRAASRTVAWQIALACALAVLIALAAAMAFIIHAAGGLRGILHDVSDPGDVTFDGADLLQGLALAGTAGIVVAAIVGWLVARHAVRPLGQALSVQRRFLADASHELRTPLTVLDARLQIALRKADKRSAEFATLSELRTDTQGLIALVNDMLLTVEAAHADLAETPVSINEAMQNGAKSLRLLADRSEIVLHVVEHGSWSTYVPELSLRRCVIAVIDNAMKHTPSGGEVTVTVSHGRKPGTAALTVSDTGSGLQGIDPARVFDRFAHADESAPSSTRGFGIGLALVREVVVTHGGTVSVTETGPDGTTLTIELPTAPAQKPDHDPGDDRRARGA